ncbi:alpha/beta hydrolase family protein [Heyndrickxia sp. NPDC080065]|uniref:alpha/beta hydrolase family protein n=1 Tax=Heyndrickxia sp. NPDC080065 TaxID=3390568 RepID=UPI003CFC4BCD
MKIQGQQITFEGRAEQENISGTFTQNGQSFPFELKKGRENKKEKDENTVQIKLKEGPMYGVLETPHTKGPFPVMILIAGSGPTDRDGNSPLLPGKNNSLKMLAENLAAHGIASIRYDKRGIGNNSRFLDKEENLQFEQYIDDAAAWIQFAKKDDRFLKVGIIGHSEGSLIGMAASAKEEVDTFISIAGAGRPIDQVLLEQLSTQLPANLLAEAKDILEKLKQGNQVQTVSPELQSIFRPSVQPYMISWLKYDPTEQLKKLNCPILIINGDHDLQVQVTDAQALHATKKESQLLIIDKMNHILKEAPENKEENIATYSNPDLPLAEGLMDGIVTFLEQV